MEVCWMWVTGKVSMMMIRGPNGQIFGQISAQNLSKILDVLVKVWTRHPKKRVFATNPGSRQKRVNAT